MDDIFSDFMMKYQKRCIAYCLAKKQTKEDSVEIVNEAFLRLWTICTEKAYFDDAFMLKWVFNAIDYIILEYSRYNKKHYAERLDNDSDAFVDPKEADEHLMYQEVIVFIESHLNENEQLLFKFVFIDKKPCKEIERILKIKNQALRTRLSRLRDKIEKIIKINEKD